MKIDFKNLMTFVFTLTLLLCISGNCCTEAEQGAFKQNSVSLLNAEMEDYVTLARRRIKNNWYPPTDAFENSATIVLTIDRSGQLKNCHLSAPSPSESFNESLINAAKQAAYEPLPSNYPGNSVDIDLDFSMHRRTISK